LRLLLAKNGSSIPAPAVKWGVFSSRATAGRSPRVSLDLRARARLLNIPRNILISHIVQSRIADESRRLDARTHSKVSCPALRDERRTSQALATGCAIAVICEGADHHGVSELIQVLVASVSFVRRATEKLAMIRGWSTMRRDVLCPAERAPPSSRYFRSHRATVVSPSRDAVRYRAAPQDHAYSERNWVRFGEDRSAEVENNVMSVLNGARLVRSHPTPPCL